jgi:hypothetical protein
MPRCTVDAGYATIARSPALEILTITVTWPPQVVDRSAGPVLGAAHLRTSRRTSAGHLRRKVPVAGASRTCRSPSVRDLGPGCGQPAVQVTATAPVGTVPDAWNP